MVTMGGADRGRGVWLRWVAANAVAECVGLGASALVAVLVLTRDDPSAAAVVGGAVAVVATGAVEGAAVGWAQWRVLRRPLPSIPARAWIVATVLGALVAWTLGMLPTTLLDLGSMDAAAGETVEPATWVQLVLAAGMGLVLGPVLAVFQWWVLRRHLAGAGWWVPANALAWAVGMPLVFLVAGGAPEGVAPAGIAALVLVTLLLTGAVVGAVHGTLLVRLLRGGGDAGGPVSRDVDREASVAR
jgi:hypothetical protein